MKIQYEQLLERIKTTTNIPQEEIEKRLQEKMEQLSGLISKEGAAHILANELGIKSNQSEMSLKINMLYAGLKTGEIIGRVVRKFDIREFQSGERSGKVGTFIIGDETGTIRVTCWHNQTKEMEPLQENDIVLIKNGSIRENRGVVEIHLNEKTELLRNPEGKTVKTVKQNQVHSTLRKHIKDLTEGDINIELIGTIIQVYELRFFERCPVCRKRIREHDIGFQCPEHGLIKPEYSYVMNLYLDDGTGTIRVVFFGNQIQQLLKKQDEEIQIYRTAPEAFEKIKTDLLGELIKIIGKVTKNQMFDRLEYIAARVETNINPEEEIARLQKELEKVQV